MSATEHVAENGSINEEAIVALFPKLHEDFLRSAICMMNNCHFTVQSGMGEMPFQQFIYSPLSALLLAAAGGFTGQKYSADRDVHSSVWVHVREKVSDSDDKDKPGSLSMQPDAVATLIERFNTIGMMEIKPENTKRMSRNYLVDYYKCVLATAGTAIILSSCLDKSRSILLFWLYRL